MPARSAAPPAAALAASKATAPTAAVAGTAAFSKFMHVLQIVADAPEPLGLPALVAASGYPRPTVHRIVAALKAEGLVTESPRTGGLTLGLRLMQLASRSWGRSELRVAAMDELKRLRDLTGETVHLSVPNGASMVYIEKLESPSAVRMASRIGSSVCLHATAVGKAYLARLPSEARERLLADITYTAYTPHTLTNAAALRQQIEQVAARGWAQDDEEHEAGIQCFGAAVLDGRGLPVAAISVTTLRFRQKEDPLTAYVAPLRAACQAISERLQANPALTSAGVL